MGEIPVPPGAGTISGQRGLTDGLVIVVGVTVDWCAYAVDLDLIYLTDGHVRSGFAPSARIDSYVDNGAGAGDSRYELVLDGLNYSAVNEATFFRAGMCVALRRWDDDTAPTSESRIVSPTGGTGGSVYLTTAPSPGMQAIIALGQGLLTLDEYDTAGQIASAQAYLHVADDADDLIGSSTDFGFRMG